MIILLYYLKMNLDLYESTIDYFIFYDVGHTDRNLKLSVNTPLVLDHSPKVYLVVAERFLA